MAASFRNFLITFLIASLLFGGLAYFYYDDLEAMIPHQDGGNTSSATSDPNSSVSGATSDVGSSTVSGGIFLPSGPDEDLGAVNGLVVKKGRDGKVLSARFLRINSATKKVVTCDLSLAAVLYNRVGSLVPLGDYLRIYSIEQAAQAVCSLTGFPADFYLVVTPDSVESLASNLGSVSLPLRQAIRYVNPIYGGKTFSDGELLPLDYYIEIPSGTNLFSEGTLSMIFGDYAKAYASGGDSVQGPSPDDVLQEVYTYLLGLLSGERKAELRADHEKLASALSGSETNIDSSFLAERGELLFRYGDEGYAEVVVPYTTRDKTLHSIKQETP